MINQDLVNFIADKWEFARKFKEFASEWEKLPTYSARISFNRGSHTEFFRLEIDNDDSNTVIKGTRKAFLGLVE
jgi:hypothetical protein